MTDPWDDCIFTYMYHRNTLNVGMYTIHGSYGKVGLVIVLASYILTFGINM